MIGIDIVDLKDPLFKARSPRSLSLISNENDKSIDHPQLFWLFWSAKEAVFKTNREVKSFAPKDIPIKLKVKNSKITFKSGDVKGKIKVKKKYILAVATTKDEKLKHSIVKEQSDNWSTTIRRKITTYFLDKGISAEVNRAPNGLPILNDRLPISITHHGNYAAFAYPNSFLAE